MPEDKLPIPQFAAKIKAKYPEYKDMDDTLLVNKIVAKYPEYNSQVDMGNEQSLLKKKETTTPTSNDGGLLGGVTQSTSNPQLKSEKEGFKDAGIFGRRKAEERNPLYLADEYKDLIGKKKTISTGGGSSFGLGTTGFQEVQDDEAKAKADKIEMDLLKRGYNVKKLVKDTEGLPKEFFNNDNTSKEALFVLMKQNPIKYNDIVNSAKTVYAIAEKSDAATANQFNHLNNIQYGGLENFIEGKRDQQAIIDRTLVGNERDEAHNRLMENSSKFINAANPDLIKEYQQSPLSAKVDINQYAGLKTLEIFKPEQYQQAIDFLGKDLMNLKTANPSMDLSGVMNTSLGTNGNVKSIAIGVNEKLGKESLLRQLSDLGRNNAITGLTKDQYELNSAFEQAATPEEQEQIKQQYVQNQAQINAIREEAKNDKNKFPLTEKLKLDKLAKEVTQQPGVGVGGYAGLKFVKGFENTGNSLEDIAINLFGSKDDKTNLQMRRLGEMQSWENDLYLPESLKTEQSPYILQASKPLKDKVKTFLNGRSIGDLSREEKDKLNKIISDNEGEIETITNPELGKSKNFLTKATMYQNAGFLGDIGSLVAQTYGLGALGAGRLVTTMTPMFTTSYSDYFNQAVAEGKPMNKASEYAFTHASIMALAGLINPKLDIVKRAVGINTAAGKLLANISEDSWNEITSKGSKWINKFKDAGTGVAKEAAKMTAVYGVGTSIANDLADKALFDKNISADEMAEHAVTAGKDMLFGSAGLLGINFLTHTIKNKTISPLEKASLWDLGDNPDLGHLKIDEAVAKGDITKEQGEQRKAAITEVSALIDKIPTLNKEGKPMTDAQRADYLYNEFVKTKAKEVKKDLPKAQVQEVEQKELEADHANNIIYTDLSLSELEKRQSKIEKELEPKKDADGKVIELPEKEANDLKAELVAVKEAIQNQPKESNVVGVGEDISTDVNSELDRNNISVIEDGGWYLVGNYTPKSEGKNPSVVASKNSEGKVETFNTKEEANKRLEELKQENPLEQSLKETPIEGSVGGEVKAEEPVLPKGRTPVTISGATESERQQSIEQRKKEEKQTPMTKDRDIILERIRKFNTLTRPQRRNASYEENSIRLAVDSFNEKHGKKHSFGKNSNGFLVLRGEPSAKKSYGTTISTALKGGERGIVDNGKALHERGDKVKEVFNDLLENNVLPIGRRVNGEKMSEAEFDGTIQDVMDGIPSLRAENYLNSLERQIAEDSFDYGNPDKNAAPTTLKEALGIEQEMGEPMSVEKMEEWLKNEADISPEEQQTFDNIENLVTFYEQRNEEGTTGKISEPSQKPTTSDSGEIKQNAEVKEQPTNTKEQVVTPIESKQKDLSLQDKTKNNANNIINGKAVFERFSPQEQRGFTEGGTRNVEASLLLATSEGTSGKDKPQRDIQKEGIKEESTPPPTTPPTDKITVEGEGKDVVGITHAANEVRRKQRGLPEYQKNPTTEEALMNEAEQKIKDGYNVDELMNRLEAGDTPEPVENFIRKIYIATLDAEIAKNPTDALLAKQKRFAVIGDLVNSKLGLNLWSLRGEGSPLSTISDFYVAVMEANGVDKLTEQQKKDTQAAFEKIEKADENANAAMEAFKEEIAKLKAENEVLRQKKSVAKKGDWANQRKDAISGAREALKKLRSGESGLSAVPLPGIRELIAVAPHVKKYVGALLGEGAYTLKEVVSKAYDEFKDILEGITEKDIHNILAGEYNESKPTRNDLAEKMRDLRDEAYYVNKLEKLINGVEPKQESEKIKRNKNITDLQKKIKDLQKELPPTDAQLKAKLVSIKSKNETETKKIKERIENGDFEIKKKVPILEDMELKRKFPKEYNAAVDAILAREEARHEFDIAIMKAELANRTKAQKATDLLSKAGGTVKAITTGIDDSAVAIQTYVSMLVRPRTGVQAFTKHIEHAFSQKRFDRWLAVLHNSSDFPLMQKAGLNVTEPSSLKEAQKEELFNNRFDGTVKIKGKEYKLIDAPLRPFERAFTTLGNVTRVVGFRTIAAKYMKKGYTFENSPELFKSLAERLNTETGRGKQNEYIEHASKVVTMGIWSPRLMATKFNILGVSDLASLLLSKVGTKGYYRQLHPKERLAAIGDIAQFATTVMALSYGLGYAFGGKVDDDPLSSTYLDVKMPNGKSYNFTGGFSSYMRVISQFAMGKKSIDGTEKDAPRLNTMGRFFRGKTPPLTSFAINLASGKDFMSRPTSLSNELVNLAPISVRGIVEQVNRDGASSLITQGLPTFFGLNVKSESDFGATKSYTDEQTKSPKLKFIFDKGLELPQDPNKATVSPKIVVDDKHPKGEFTEDEYDYFKKERAKLIVEKIGKKVDNQETKFVNRKDDEGNSTFRGSVKFNELDPDLLKKELSNIAGDATDEAKKKTIEKFNIKVSKAQ